MNYDVGEDGTLSNRVDDRYSMCDSVVVASLSSSMWRARLAHWQGSPSKEERIEIERLTLGDSRVDWKMAKSRGIY